MKRLTLFLLIPVFGYAQQYVAEAPLSRVPKNGYYFVTLPPDITSALDGYMGNVRILDNKNAEVPYITSVDVRETNTFTWTPMEIEKQVNKGCCTVITIINDKKEYIDNFLLKFKNANVLKTAGIRGSDDGELWYAVNEKFTLQGVNNSDEIVSKYIEIPLSNYKYYKLTIDDPKSSPLNIVSVERTREDIVHGGFLEIANVTIESHDSTQNRETWGVIEFDKEQYIDRLEFDINGPHLYKRNAALVTKVGNRFQTIHTFDLISGQSSPLFVEVKAKTLYVRVKNDNNPPLKFTQVAAYQLKRSLLGYFEAGSDYRIAIGDDLEVANYDIGFFRDSVQAHPDKLEVGRLKQLESAKTPASTTYFTNRNVIWVAIVLVIGVLGFMVRRMLKDNRLNGNSQ